MFDASHTRVLVRRQNCQKYERQGKVWVPFLRNKRFDSYQTHVLTVSIFPDLGFSMNVNLNFIYSHLDIFMENLRAMSDEKGEKFHKKPYDHGRAPPREVGQTYDGRLLVGH